MSTAISGMLFSGSALTLVNSVDLGESYNAQRSGAPFCRLHCHHVSQDTAQVNIETSYTGFWP